MLKILDITYAKEKFKNVANNEIHLNAEEITQLLRLLKYFGDLFDGNLGHEETVPVNLKLNPGSKPCNSAYYPVNRINKENFCKELKHLVKIVMLNMVQ